MAATVTVFGSSRVRPGEAAFVEAERLGRLLAQAGFRVATGGYGGTMEAVSLGAAKAGGYVIGITAPEVFPDRPGANPYVAEERARPTLTERIHELIQVADGVVVLPGAIGTFTELVMAWNIEAVAPLNGSLRRPVVAVGEQWRRAIAYLAELLDENEQPITCVDSVDDAVEHIAAHLAG